MSESTERDQIVAEELIDAWKANGKNEYDLFERIAEALTEARADTRADVLRDAADALRQAEIATRPEREAEGWR